MKTIEIPSYDFVGFLEKIVRWIFAHLTDVPALLKVVLSYAFVIALPVCLMLVIGIVVSIERLREIRKKEEHIYNPQVEPAFDETQKGDPTLNLRWKTITEHVESENENDWRQAILEADIILDDILSRMGYQGESIGEKMKRVEKADFQTLDQAWEAHKIRNIIAHEGASYALTQYEAKRVIGLYKQVFEEFFYL